MAIIHKKSRQPTTPSREIPGLLGSLPSAPHISMEISNSWGLYELGQLMAHINSTSISIRMAVGLWRAGTISREREWGEELTHG